MSRGGFGLHQKTRQCLLHEAAWSTYVTRRRRDGVDPDGLQTRTQALRSIRDQLPAIREHGDRSELVLTATALWSLLDVYRNGDPPKEFSELLLDVLALDVQRARELRAQPAHKVFPPFPEDPALDPESYAEFGASALVSDSSFDVGRNKMRKKTDEVRTDDNGEPFRTHAKLELCVNRDFERLTKLSDPKKWHELCPVIWIEKVVGNGDTLKGQLRLPGIPGDEEIGITLEFVGGSEPDATQTEAEMKMKAPPFIEAGYLKFHMEPERGRPGWTRIIHEREVTFFSELEQYEVPTLAYWTKSEIACLALR